MSGTKRGAPAAVVPVPASHRAIRAQVRDFARREAEPFYREWLDRLYDAWEEFNDAYFDGRLIVPVIVISEPATPRTLADWSRVSAFGARSQMRVRPSLLRGTHPFFIGAADAPVDPKPDWQPTGLKGKVEAGAQFAQTQFCMDAGVIRRYLARLSDAGINLAMLIGVNPLRSAKSANWMRNNLFGTIIPDALIDRLENAADPAAEGEHIAVELIETFAATAGVAGVHLMAPANEAAVPRVIAEARKRLPPR